MNLILLVPVSFIVVFFILATWAAFLDKNKFLGICFASLSNLVVLITLFILREMDILTFILLISLTIVLLITLIIICFVKELLKPKKELFTIILSNVGIFIFSLIFIALVNTKTIDGGLVYRKSFGNPYYTLIRVEDKRRDNYIVNDNCCIVTNKVFKDCYNIKTITTPVTQITGGGNLRSLFTTGSVNYSGYSYENISISKIIISKGDVGPYYFKGFGGEHAVNKLQRVDFLEGVTSIGENAFDRCTTLQCVSIPSSITRIGSDAFKDCSKIEMVKIVDLESWLKIRFSNEASNPMWHGADMYLKNEILSDLVIPNSIHTIEEYAFFNCSSLKSIIISENTTTVEHRSFVGCDNIEEIIVDSNNKRYDSRENCNALIETKSNALIIGCKNTVIPNSVVSIGDYAFNSCPNLINITIPNSVTSIGNYAFSNCDKLKNVTLPKKLEHIGKYAFSNCNSISEIIIPISVTTIGTFALSIYKVHIKCEATSRPSGWDAKWTDTYSYNIFWGYKEK